MPSRRNRSLRCNVQLLHLFDLGTILTYRPLCVWSGDYKKIYRTSILCFASYGTWEALGGCKILPRGGGTLMYAKLRECTITYVKLRLTMLNISIKCARDNAPNIGCPADETEVWDADEPWPMFNFSTLFDLETILTYRPLCGWSGVYKNM